MSTKGAVEAGVPAVELVGEDAYLHGESVLALFGLADVNPKQIKVAVAKRARPQLPAYVELTDRTADAPTTSYNGLRAQPVVEAILECRGRIETHRLLDAAKEARKEGLLTMSERQRVRRGLQL